MDEPARRCGSDSGTQELLRVGEGSVDSCGPKQTKGSGVAARVRWEGAATTALVRGKQRRGSSSGAREEGEEDKQS